MATFPCISAIIQRYEAGSFQEAAASPFSIVKFSLIRGHITRLLGILSFPAQQKLMISIGKNPLISVIMVGYRNGDAAGRSVCQGRTRSPLGKIP